jgi:protein-disulfide isomerase/uncharacterized membrane protein
MQSSIDYTQIIQRKGFSNFARPASTGLIILGLILSAYLLYRYQMLVGSKSKNTVDFCSAVFGHGCDSALKSKVSSQLGLPLAAWSFIYYAIIGLLLTLSWYVGQPFKKGIILTTLFVSFLAGISSLLLLGVMIVKPHLFCPVCTGLHIINLLLFFALKSISELSFAKMFKNIRFGVLSLFVKKQDDGDLKWKVLIYAFVFLFFISLYEGFRLFVITNATNKSIAFNPQQFLSDFNKQPHFSIPVIGDDHIWGDINTPAEIVVFSDFQCPACRYFFNVLNEVKNKYAGKYHVVFKHFPLNTACNPSVKNNIHPKACEAALASEAAGEQGRFWEYHDALFNANLHDPNNSSSSLAVKMRLDANQFARALTSKDASDRIKRNVAEAIRLNVNSTPAIFFNGRRVSDMRVEAIELLIKNKVAMSK